jgi:hypothetical protein
MQVHGSGRKAVPPQLTEAAHSCVHATLQTARLTADGAGIDVSTDHAGMVHLLDCVVGLRAPCPACSRYPFPGALLSCNSLRPCRRCGRPASTCCGRRRCWARRGTPWTRCLNWWPACEAPTTSSCSGAASCRHCKGRPRRSASSCSRAPARVRAPAPASAILLAAAAAAATPSRANAAAGPSPTSRTGPNGSCGKAGAGGPAGWPPWPRLGSAFRSRVCGWGWGWGTR